MESCQRVILDLMEMVMRGVFATALYAAALACPAFLVGPAAAQEEPASRPLTLTVRPSGRDPSPDEALARQERLLKRMSQNDFMFRSICVQCGDAWKHNSYAPFDPTRSLKGGSPEPSPSPPEPETTATQP
jgi:hypothetical protein